MKYYKLQVQKKKQFYERTGYPDVIYFCGIVTSNKKKAITIATELLPLNHRHMYNKPQIVHYSELP